jgi:hypothetical protein
VSNREKIRGIDNEKSCTDGSWKKGELEEGEFISGEGKIIYEGGDYYEGELKGLKRHGYGKYMVECGGIMMMMGWAFHGI